MSSEVHGRGSPATKYNAINIKRHCLSNEITLQINIIVSSILIEFIVEVTIWKYFIVKMAEFQKFLDPRDRLAPYL